MTHFLRTSLMDSFRRSTLGMAVAVVIVALLAGGCGSTTKESPNPQPTPTAKPTNPEPAQPQPQSTEVIREVTAELAQQVTELWDAGSGFSHRIATLVEAKAGKTQEIYGTVVRTRVANIPGLSRYQLYQYLVKIEKVWGQPYGIRFIHAPGVDPARPRASRRPTTSLWERNTEDPEDGRLEDGPISVGDYVWVGVRVISADRPTVEQLITKGDTFWAVYDRMPLIADHVFLSPIACPKAWTARVPEAYVMGMRMGSD